MQRQLVTQSIESNVNILANSPMAENIISILQGMPFDYYRCEDVVDTFAIPCFILFLDGHVLTKDNKDIGIWECYLTGWSGRMSKCPRCRNFNGCSTEKEYVDTGPDYNKLVILFHADKIQRQVEGLVSVIPPMPVTGPFSLELEEWLKATCLARHKKALRWRAVHEQWEACEIEKYVRKQKTFKEIADEKWTSEKMTFNFPGPEF